MSPLFFALVLLLQQQPASVEGFVTKAGGTLPLAGAKVALKGIATNNYAEPAIVSSTNLSFDEVFQMATTATEDDGRFIFRNIPPGDYTVLVESAAYGTAAYGQRKPDGPGSTISLSPGQRVTDIKVSMVPRGAIAGRITGRNGEPVVQAIVQAFQYSYRDGLRMLNPVKTAMANDLGEYRLFSLPAGRYFIAASMDNTSRIYGMSPARLQTEMARLNAGPSPLQIAMIAQEYFSVGRVIERVLDDGTVQEEAWMPTYYPATPLSSQATPVDVAAGATMNGVNISISPQPVRKISGQVVGPPGSLPEVSLTTPMATVGIRSITTNAAARGNSFEFRGVVPGPYTLVARDQRNGNTSPPVQVEVGDRDVDNLTIGIVPGITITGRLVVENSVEGAAGIDSLQGVTIGLTPQFGSPRAVVAPNGDLSLDPLKTLRPDGTRSFTVSDVSPGNYRVDVQYRGDRAAGQKPVFVKSVRLGQKDVTDWIPITGDMRDGLEIVITNDSGVVEGSVLDSRRMPAAGATVVLVPSVARDYRFRYVTAVADSAGRFRLQKVVAGDYLAFAWEDIENGAWQNADFLRAYESRGRAVKVSGASKQDVQLSVISGP